MRDSLPRVIEHPSTAIACLALAWIGSIDPCAAREKEGKKRVGVEYSRLEKVAGEVKARLASEAATRNRLDRQINRFQVKNGPMYYVVRSLRQLGINVCHEAVDADVEWYLDSEDVAAFAADGVFTIDFQGGSVRQLMDRICEVDPRYKWTHYTKGGLIVLAPKDRSRLDVLVGPAKDEGNPVEILLRLDRAQNAPPLAPSVIRGHNNLPNVVLDSPRCSATELLNQIVAQHPGMTWGFGGRASFNYVRNTTADAVRIEFPSLTKGKPVSSEWTYDVAERLIDGVSTVVVEKRRTAKPVTTTPAQVPVGGEAPPAVRQDDGRAQEPNVVASRLAGSWTIETKLNERLTGKPAGARTTLVVTVDQAVEKKVPARFMKALKDGAHETQIYLAGHIEIDGAKHPFILTAIHGNPHLIYFRERGGDPFGDSESFNLALAPSHNRDNDLLFVGGDFNNQPFRAYSRVAIEKEDD